MSHPNTNRFVGLEVRKASIAIARRVFLLGEGEFDRKAWIEKRLEELTQRTNARGFHAGERPVLVGRPGQAVPPIAGRRWG